MQLTPNLLRTALPWALALALMAPAVASAQAAGAKGKANNGKEAEPAEPRPAVFGEVDQLAAKAREAFAAYSYRSAQEHLERAVELAQEKHVLGHKDMAPTYMLLGVTAVAGFNDLYRGILWFAEALRLQPDIQVPRELATPQLIQMHKQARQSVQTVGKPPTVKLQKPKSAQPEQVEKDKKQAKLGLVHTPLETAKRNYPIPIKAEPGIDVQASKLLLYYRPAGQVNYLSLAMQKRGGAYRASIPAAMTKGRYVHYYIQAMDARGRPTARHGSARGPNVVIIK